MKPDAEMKNIGQNVHKAFKHFDIKQDPNNLLVFSDAMHVGVGKYRIVSGLSFYGHSGLKDISANMGGLNGF